MDAGSNLSWLVVDAVPSTQVSRMSAVCRFRNPVDEEGKYPVKATKYPGGSSPAGGFGGGRCGSPLAGGHWRAMSRLACFHNLLNFSYVDSSWVLLLTSEPGRLWPYCPRKSGHSLLLP